ncbi:zinc finger protein CONSTANS-LIKE 6-like [Pyrus ussuriensis x Pyrus communis]|uniref:Zinc finger protein CONSTANS-LIKE 6-like n=1 Tax=Pyrus ussuriensis x Pyrus communis TaxID=2448454 RepID=A0A5N5I2L9_9ROSA|nr:zinc finger protein CONSTANS-LIKE 6-like [Pyrus ussuriensis x Pyrus communis]
MNSSKKVAHAVGGKTARACDSCIKKRARWYCAADDGFLCQACDSAVHSANQLAHRHKRVLLKTASSLKPSNKDDRASAVSETSAAPSWHRGFTRKARTPRGGKSMTHHGKSEEGVRNLFPQVPEVGGDDNNSYDEENEEDQQLLYRVPIFDPSVAELCSNSGNSSEDAAANYEANNLSTVSDNVGSQSKAVSSLPNCNGHDGFLLPSDMDLAEFAADVDSLLGRGLNDDQCIGMEGLGLRDCKEKESNGRVKLEEDDDQDGIDGVDFMGCQLGESEIDMMKEPFVLNFEDYDDSPASCGEQDDKMIVGIDSNCTEDHEHEEADEDAIDNSKKRKTILRLDYEAVITAWDGSPWTSGDRPDFDSECLPDYMGVCGPGLHYPYGDLNGIGVHPAMVDGGREARVSRYREKRRTRLFSKKIRYEVRKLNAEKRPRMKGRFVKRSSFAGSAFPVLAK